MGSKTRARSALSNLSIHPSIQTFRAQFPLSEHTNMTGSTHTHTHTWNVGWISHFDRIQYVHTFICLSPNYLSFFMSFALSLSRSLSFLFLPPSLSLSLSSRCSIIPSIPEDLGYRAAEWTLFRFFACPLPSVVTAERKEGGPGGRGVGVCVCVCGSWWKLVKKYPIN